MQQSKKKEDCVMIGDSLMDIEGGINYGAYTVKLSLYCNYVNKFGFTLFNSLPKPIMWFLCQLRFMESRIVLRKNGIPRKSIKVIRNIKDIRPDDIVIGYRHVPSSLRDMKDIRAFKTVSMIHFHGEQSDSDLIKEANPDVLFNEADLQSHQFNLH